MKFSVVFQTDPPAERVVSLSKLAEQAGFSAVWTFDSPVLWQEPFVIYSQILAATSTLRVGPMVTNPSSRDWTVTASLFATLNDMFGNRTICGIGRGDSALRVAGGKPASLSDLRDAITVIKDLAEGRSVDYNGKSLEIPWINDGQLDIWMAAYGPKALQLAGSIADGLILQVADPCLVEWASSAAREAVVAAGRPVDDFAICVAAPAYIGSDIVHQRDQVRWFGGMVGNHVADLVARYGQHSAAVPAALTDYIKDREGYDYAHHGRADNPDTAFVPDDVIDRFCVLGDVDNHVARLAELQDLGVDEFAVYMMHDDIENTIAAYGESIIPQFVETAMTKETNNHDR